MQPHEVDVARHRLPAEACFCRTDLADLGFFAPDAPVERIDGHIYARLPHTPDHADRAPRLSRP